MALTCQLVPVPVSVTAYPARWVLRPVLLETRWVIATTKVMLPGPKARSEVIAAVAVATCRLAVLAEATPGVL